MTTEKADLAAMRKELQRLKKGQAEAEARLAAATARVTAAKDELRTLSLREFLEEELAYAEQWATEKVAADGWQMEYEPGIGAILQRGSERLKEGQFDAVPAAEMMRAIVNVRVELKKSPDAAPAVFSGLLFAAAYASNGRGTWARRVQQFIQRERARKPRAKPPLGTRALMIAWDAGHRDTASVREFFNGWRGRLIDDDWGGLSLEATESGWSLIDEGARAGIDGAKPEKEISAASLPSLVSRFKKARDNA